MMVPHYPLKTPHINRFGIDPTAEKFSEFHESDINYLASFFDSQAYFSLTSKKAKIITSLSMFYDLEDPVSFVRDIKSCLASDGVWHFEQSYLPLMLRNCSYDTICHEHLEYYTLFLLNIFLQKLD